MAGLLGLLGGLILLGDSVSGSVHRDIGTKSARENALRRGDETYYDGWRNLRWTETNEIVDQLGLCGSYDIVGRKTGTVYKRVLSPEVQVRNREIEKLEKGLEYCRQNGIKYFPYYFPNSLSRRPCWNNTGIEVETGKKYCCYECGSELYWEGNKLKDKPKYRLIYLEDKPHWAWHERGGDYKEYDAIHIGEGWNYSEPTKYSSEKRHEKGKGNCFYHTKFYEVSEEEAKARTTELPEFPYEHYTLRR